MTVTGPDGGKPPAPPAGDRSAARSRLTLLVALGTDNFGAGLFLPLVLIYLTGNVGLSVGTAGAVLAVGTAVGLVVPASIGRVVDRVGPRTVVIASQVVQAAGLGSYLLADGLAVSLVAAVLLAAGTQMFYSALLTLVSEAAPKGPKDRTFALVSMVRAGAFGAGSLAAGVLLSFTGDTGLRVSVAVDAATCLVSAVLLWRFVVPVTRVRAAGHQERPSPRVLRNPTFLLLIAVAGLTQLAGDFFLVGFPLYNDRVLELPPWVTGTAVAVVTGVTTLGGTLAVRLTRHQRRTTTLALGVALILLWCLAVPGAVWLPLRERIGWTLLATLVFALGAVLCDTKTGAMAEAAAPPEQRGAYLAAFQYSFTFAQLFAPSLAGLFSLAHWLPWSLIAVSLVASLGLLRLLARRLPAHAVHVTGPAPADTV